MQGGRWSLFWISDFNLNLKSESTNERKEQEQGKNWGSSCDLKGTQEIFHFFYQSWLMEKSATSISKG